MDLLESVLPLERAMSGVFRPAYPQPQPSRATSRMSISERRWSAQTHEPQWAAKGLAAAAAAAGGGSPRGQALVAGARGFGLGFGAKFALSVLLGLVGRNESLGQVLRGAGGRDTARFAAFFGLWSAIFRGANAAMYEANGRKDNQRHAFVAGALAGLALLVDDPERRRLVAIYVFVRSVSVMIKALSREQVIPYWEHAESAFFGLVNGPIMFAFLLEPDLMEKGYYRWILNMGEMTHMGLDVTLRERYRTWHATGELLPFCSCQPHYHTGSCMGHCTSDWVFGLGRAAKIYLPVHLVPLLVFRYKKLREDPMKQLRETAKALLLSSMFLSTYVFCVKMSQCLLRNALQADTMGQATFSGFLTGFACLFERPSRVSELMLYCVPKSLEVCWNYGRKYHPAVFRTVPYFEVPIFMFGSGVLVAALKEDLKTTYFNVVKFVASGGRMDRAKPALPPTAAQPLEGDRDHDHPHPDPEEEE